MLNVVCPQDAAVGALITIETAEGTRFSVAVPAGVLPGETFTVTLGTASDGACPSDAGAEALALPPPVDGPELEERDPIGDAPGGLAALGAEMVGQRAIVAAYFGSEAVEVRGGEVLAEALRASPAAINHTRVGFSS